MKINICHKYNSLQINQDLIAQQLALLPTQFYPKIVAYTSLLKKHQRINSLLLLEEIFQNSQFDPTLYNLKSIRYTSKGKPYIDDKVNFSIAYSDKFTTVAVSINYKIGIDIEKNNPIVILDYKDYFTFNEWQIIQSSRHQIKQFYFFWTRKEALSKAIGLAVFLDFKILEVIENNIVFEQIKWQLETSFFDEYVMSVAVEKSNSI